MTSKTRSVTLLPHYSGPNSKIQIKPGTEGFWREVVINLLLVAALASTSQLQAQPLPKGVEQAIFEGKQFTAPISVSLPTLIEKPQLDAFRRAATSGRGLSPVAPPGHVERSNENVHMACMLHWIIIDTVVTRERLRFDYALATPKLQKLLPHLSTGYWGGNKIPAAKRKLQVIDYRNRYKVNPMGMGERDVFAVTFSYTIESILEGLPSPATTFKGKATAQLDPEDGEWKLEKLALSDEGEAELYKSLQAKPVSCDASAVAQETYNGGEEELPNRQTAGTGTSGVGFIIIGSEVPVFEKADGLEVKAHLSSGTPAANAKGSFLGAPAEFALEEKNGRTHILYLQDRRMRVGWVDSRQLSRFGYDCSCARRCDPLRLTLLQGSSWNDCFERSRSSQTPPARRGGD